MKKFYALHVDGFVQYLGEFEDIADAMEKYPDDIVWYYDEQSAIEMASDILYEYRKVNYKKEK